MNDASDKLDLPPSLRFLKWLVMTLMVVMIGGVISIVALLVTRLPDTKPSLTLPDSIDLPAGEVASAITLMQDRILVVTESGRVLAYGQDGTLEQEIGLK